jgi:hypothetical protein
VELIEYKEGLAIKKTYRPGKEKYFKRELFATTTLSKELDFIPVLLEKGDGYLILPYYENVLDKASRKRKKQVLNTYKSKIIRVIHEMHARELAYINFTPANIIVTSEGRFYCTGFEYLHRYKTPPVNIEDSYEIAGIPIDFTGDHPQSIYSGASSFDKIWGAYFGRWKQVTHAKSTNRFVIGSKIANSLSSVF